jgi:GNAT superfamily N-acetyltransferase
VGSDLAGARQRADVRLVSEPLLREPPDTLRVEALGSENSQAWAELFERASSACFCRWWHFSGVKNDWLAKCALDAASNRADAESAIHAKAEEALGLVALQGADAIGWMKLSPRASVPKLRKLPIYRALDLGPDEGIWSLGCFLVDPAHRRRRVAAALLDAAPAFVAARGGRAIEAYPRHPHETEHAHLHDEEAWMGPESLFRARGYVPIAEAAATKMYPVYRLTLTGSGTTPPARST